MTMQLLIAIKPRQIAVKMRALGARISATASSPVKLYSTLFAFRTIVMHPADMKVKPSRSYFQLKRSPRINIARSIATRIPRHAPPATRVKSRNGSTHR